MGASTARGRSVTDAILPSDVTTGVGGGGVGVQPPPKSTSTMQQQPVVKQVGICRSRSAQSLKVQDQASQVRFGFDIFMAHLEKYKPFRFLQDDKTNILVQVFWICLAVLESDFEHEFLLGLR